MCKRVCETKKVRGGRGHGGVGGESESESERGRETVREREEMGVGVCVLEGEERERVRASCFRAMPLSRSHTHLFSQLLLSCTPSSFLPPFPLSNTQHNPRFPLSNTQRKQMVKRR